MSYGKLMGRLITELPDVENRRSQLLHVQVRVNVHAGKVHANTGPITGVNQITGGGDASNKRGGRFLVLADATRRRRGALPPKVETKSAALLYILGFVVLAGARSLTLFYIPWLKRPESPLLYRMK
ncbi:hypothetical protein ALC57_04250 [Trachymyrmex cornetzi]|uniref:Uncharacterized protein n=1 Tax=Trachymyrmex cornetzi TaxID=471704 RepID=A0A195EE42_9HYME|nr:hypothetical protein ALC57_04250 [Trachymyrmex cornetzi]